MTSLTPAPGEDRSIALAMVNTRRAGSADLLGTAAETSAWLKSRELVLEPARLGAGELLRLTELRGAIRELFTALADRRVPVASAIKVVNDSVRRVAAAPQLQWSTDGPSRHWLSDGPGTLDEIITTIARDAVEVVCGEKASVLHRCEAHGCVRVFFREHARRRWCSTTCGDRVRAARHHLRQTTDR